MRRPTHYSLHAYEVDQSSQEGSRGNGPRRRQSSRCQDDETGAERSGPSSSNGQMGLKEKEMKDNGEPGCFEHPGTPKAQSVELARKTLCAHYKTSVPH